MTMARIHATALVDAGAALDGDVTVGPYAVVGPEVEVAAGTWIGAHAVIEGPTRIGRDNQIYQFASIGAAPQDKKYAGEPTRLEVGDRNVFREFTTINRGTAQGLALTAIGDDNLMMAYVHVAHDCIVGNRTIFANCTSLGGHVVVGDWVILGGYTGVHQFCKIGAHSMTGVGSVILHDLPPFVRASGNTASAHGINTEGLRRRGFDAETINLIRRAYRTLYRSGLTLEQARVALAEQAAALRRSDAPPAAADAVTMVTDFLGTVTRGIVR
jgi:UDP-N-acetylglucosamine acyltransferase